jgi:hypothetical protein
MRSEFSVHANDQVTRLHEASARMLLGRKNSWSMRRQVTDTDKWQPIPLIIEQRRLKRCSINNLSDLIDVSDAPLCRDFAQLGVLEAVGEEVGYVFGKVKVSTLGLRMDGIEVHEPRVEDRSRHRLQRLVHAAVQLDLVVQRAEDVGDCTLFADV